VCIGFLDKYTGLVTAMTAHMMIDIILFYKLTNVDLLFLPKTDDSNSQNNQESIP